MITSVRNIQKISKGPFRNVGLGQHGSLEKQSILHSFYESTWIVLMH